MTLTPGIIHPRKLPGTELLVISFNYNFKIYFPNMLGEEGHRYRKESVVQKSNSSLHSSHVCGSLFPKEE